VWNNRVRVLLDRTVDVCVVGLYNNHKHVATCLFVKRYLALAWSGHVRFSSVHFSPVQLLAF
jgi:hypothetical protein